MNKGFIAISSILIISFIAVSLSTVVTLLSIGAGQSALSQTSGEQTQYLLHGCIEDALLKSWSSPLYTGGSLTRPEGSCSVSVSKSGSDWTLIVTTTGGTHTKSARVTLTRTTSITITSWTEW